MLIKYLFIIILIKSELKVWSQPTDSITEQLQAYEVKVNTSLHLDKEDRQLINTWKQDLQVKQVNLTTFYRLQMTSHRHHSFKILRNEKWNECLRLHRIDINRSEHLYYENEGECLKEAYVTDNKQNAVEQIEKEIRKWRKSYRYLKKLCRTEHLDDEENLGSCLFEYMQRDNYDVVFQRLIEMKQQTMSTVFLEMYSTISKLEECLKTSFSEFLQNVRSVMDTLNKCYGA